MKKEKMIQADEWSVQRQTTKSSLFFFAFWIV
jgi:hypothetical protein